MDVSPTHKRGEARRADILRIAREVFLQEGYAAASMSEIAARVGGSKGTLYNHFRSKEALFAAVLREAFEGEAAEAFDFGDDHSDLAGALTRLGGRFLRLMLSDPVIAVHRVVIAEGARFPELGRTYYEAGPREGVARLSALLEGEMDAGRLRRADPVRAAEHFIDLCKSGLHQRRLWSIIDQPSEAAMDANVAAAVEVFLAAYRV